MKIFHPRHLAPLAAYLLTACAQQPTTLATQEQAAEEASRLKLYEAICANVCNPNLLTPQPDVYRFQLFPACPKLTYLLKVAFNHHTTSYWFPVLLQQIYLQHFALLKQHVKQLPSAIASCIATYAMGLAEDEGAYAPPNSKDDPYALPYAPHKLAVICGCYATAPVTPSLLHLAIALGDETLVEKSLAWFTEKGTLTACLLQSGPLTQDTPLHTAARWGRIAIINALLTKGVQPNATNEKGETPLHLAANQETAQLLLEKCEKLLASAPTEKVVSASPKAATKNTTEQQAKKVAPALEAKDKKGNTPLHTAAYQGRADVCKFLLEEGAEIEARDKKANTPLHTAASQGRTEVCQFLLEKWADIDAEAEYGLPPLGKAIERGHMETSRATY